jgi:hypothetical protein
MIDRGLLARIKAKAAAKAPVATNKKEPVTPLQLVDADGVVTKSYNSLAEAVADDYNELNVKKALKNGTKYKGYLWNYAK